MINLSIENLYFVLDKHIKLVESYTEIKHMAFLIKACRLKPYSYVFNKKTQKIELFKKWFDEYGNSLNLIKGRRIVITQNDTSLDTSKIICTDLYYGLSLNKIAKISKMAFCYYGKDEDFQQDCCMITFLGIDNYLRTYLYYNNEWKQVSSLMLGMNNLKLLIKYLDAKHFHKFSKKENTPIPCISGEAWLTFLPPSDDLLSLVKKECDYIIPILQ